MSEQVMTVKLSDLQTVRIVCQLCGGTVEVAAKGITNKLGGNECPLCGESFLVDKYDVKTLLPFVRLKDLFEEIDKIKSKVKIEFAIKVPS